MLDQKLTVRACEPSDYPALADLTNAVNRSLGDERRVTVQDMELDFSSPDFDRANDSFLVERAGEIVGMASLEFSPASEVSRAFSAVHPDHLHQGVGTELIRRTEARVLARGDAEAPGQSLSLQRYTSDQNQAAIHLFEAQGYRFIRTYNQMRIDLTQPVHVLPLPRGIVLRPFERERHGRAVYEVQQETFADYWGFEPSSYEEWAHFLLDAPDIDFSLWRIAFDNATNEIAGICLNKAYGDGDPHMAWVRILGVRRPWRKHGLGLGLLKHSFSTFQARGYLRAGLGVDAANPTNAVALYERAGMHVHRRNLAYHKPLRGELSEQST